MWKVFAEAVNNSSSPVPSTQRMPTAKENSTFSAHEASTFNVDQSLAICKQLFEQSWQSYDNEHFHLMWKDSLNTAVEGCKGLLNLSTEKALKEFKQEAELWFILFLTFVGISIATMATLLYLISKMRQFISLKKCLMTSIESRESRPAPQALQPPINTRPIMKSTNNSSWVNPQSPQPHPQPQAGGPPSHPQP